MEDGYSSCANLGMADTLRPKATHMGFESSSVEAFGYLGQVGLATADSELANHQQYRYGTLDGIGRTRSVVRGSYLRLSRRARYGCWPFRRYLSHA